MNREDWKKTFYRSLSGFLSLALAIILYFVILRFRDLQGIFQWIKGILTPFLYGGIMAYLLKSPCNFFERLLKKYLPKKQKKHADGLAVFLVMLVSLYLIYLLLSLVIPEIVMSITALTDALPEKIEELTAWLSRILEDDEVISKYVNTTINSLSDRLEVWAQQDLMPMMESVMGGFASTVTSIVTVLYDVFIGVIVCVYLLCSRKTFARQGKEILYALPKQKRADQVLEELRYIDKTFVGFFCGKILDSAIVGLICYVFCLIMSFVTGFRNAMLISVIIGVTNIIPYFGPFIGAIPSALLILISSPTDCVIFLIFIIILQQIDGNILGPKLLAGSVGLSGFWVLFSITLFGGLFGFMGILTGVPVFAVIYDAVRRLVKKGLRKNGRTDLLQEDEKEKPNEDRTEQSMASNK